MSTGGLRQGEWSPCRLLRLLHHLKLFLDRCCPLLVSFSAPPQDQINPHVQIQKGREG